MREWIGTLNGQGASEIRYFLFLPFSNYRTPQSTKGAGSFTFDERERLAAAVVMMGEAIIVESPSETPIRIAPPGIIVIVITGIIVRLIP